MLLIVSILWFSVIIYDRSLGLEGFLQVDEVNEKHPRIHNSENGDIIIENREFWWDPPAQDEVELVKRDVNIATDGEVEMKPLDIHLPLVS